MSRSEPPQDVNSKGKFGIVNEVLLLAILFFEVVHIALVVVNGSHLLAHQVKGEVSKEKALNKGEDTANEGVWVHRSRHVVTSVLTRQQIVKRQHHEQTQHGRGDANVNDELQEVLHVAVANTVVNPGAVVVHLVNTEATLAAVVSPLWFPSLFALALRTALYLHVLGLERRLHAFTDASWISKRGPQMANDGHETRAVEAEKVKEAFVSEWDALEKLQVQEARVVPVKDKRSVRHEHAVENESQGDMR